MAMPWEPFSGANRYATSVPVRYWLILGSWFHLFFDDVVFVPSQGKGLIVLVEVKECSRFCWGYCGA